MCDGHYFQNDFVMNCSRLTTSGNSLDDFRLCCLWLSTLMRKKKCEFRWHFASYFRWFYCKNLIFNVAINEYYLNKYFKWIAFRWSVISNPIKAQFGKWETIITHIEWGVMRWFRIRWKRQHKNKWWEWVEVCVSHL